MQRTPLDREKENGVDGERKARSRGEGKDEKNHGTNNGHARRDLLLLYDVREGLFCWLLIRDFILVI